METVLMKLTKETLKQLIKEELEEMMHGKAMSRQEKLEKIVSLIMNDDIGLVDYPTIFEKKYEILYFRK